MYLLDTNTVIYYMNAALPANAMLRLNGIVDNGCYLSVITKMEVLGFAFPSVADQQAMETFVAGCNILMVNDEVVNATIAIRKTRKIKLPDAIIGATSLVQGYTLLSRNLADFKNIPGLVVVDPFSW